MNRPPAMNRRAFVLGLGAAGLAAACGGGNDDDAESGAASGPVIDDGFRFLQPGFADGFRVPTTLVSGGSERAPFVLFGPDGLPAVNDIPDTIDAMLTRPDGEVAEVSLPQRGAGLAVPHYPLVFDAPEPGVYVLQTSVGGQPQQVEFMVAARTDVGLVHVGEPMRAVETPTFDDARGVDPICTRFEPCPFHEQSLVDVLGNGRPTALMVATPGFCQTTSCGPVVDLLIEVDPSDSMDVVHAEVYTEPARLAELGLVPELLAPVVSTYAMDFEPSLLVAGGDDIVTARLDYSFDRDEIKEALATAG